MKFTLLTLSLLTATFAYGQTCPADPNQLILGGPWAFQLHTGSYAAQAVDMRPRPSTIDSVRDMRGTPQAPGAAAIGTFTAQPGGTLTATLTESNSGEISRRATVSGRYQVYGDCSGGEIMIMLNGFAAQLEFVWTNNFTQMLFVSDALSPRYGGNVVLTGNARRAPAGCPAGLGDAVNLLNGSTWSYRLSQAYYYAPGDASVGTFRAFVTGGAGFLSAIETSNTAAGLVSRQMRESGRYQVYGDCSGGEIMLMNRAPGAVQLEYVFVGAGFDEMFLLNDDAAKAADVALAGQAFRY